MKKAFVVLLALLAVAPAVVAQGFPKPGPMAMSSQIELPLYVDGVFAEDVVFNSRIQVDMGQAYQTSTGTRQIDFVATSWEAAGYSKVLGRKVTFRLSGERQPTSTAVALTEGGDYPAILTFRATYDATIEGLGTLRGLGGLAGGQVNSLPPGVANLDVAKSIKFTDGVSQFEFKGGKCAKDKVISLPNIPWPPPPPAPGCNHAVAVANPTQHSAQ